MVRQEEIKQRGVSQRPKGDHFSKKGMMEINVSKGSAK